MNANIPMPLQASANSRLAPRPYPLEEVSIAGIIDDVDQRVRIMCRMMQLYRFDNRPSVSAEDEVSDLCAAMDVFYEYVDRQMDTLSTLAVALEKEGYVSLKSIRKQSNG